MTKKTIATVSLAAMLLAGMTGTAYAASVSSSISGARTTISTTAYAYQWDWTVYDTANDGQFVSSEAYLTSYRAVTLVNKKGPNTYSNTMLLGDSGNRPSRIHACRSNTALPMSCAAWVSTGF